MKFNKHLFFILIVLCALMFSSSIRSEEKKPHPESKDTKTATATVNPKTTEAQSKEIEKKIKDLKDKEDQLKKQELRLNALKKDVDERISKYNKILSQVEEMVGKSEQSKKEKLDYMVKVFESMTPEDAANRIKLLDDTTAIKIFLNMKTKKSGLIMAQLPAEKVALLTEKITHIEKNFPIK